MLVACLAHAMAAGPLAPPEALRSLRLADEALVVELVAAEPDVVSPVALAWDARGRLFVAEMRDYPADASGGAIRLLVDADADGRAESSSVFAEGLSFPSSVLPWRDGVLVTAAPDILFLRDSNDDGRADERRVLFTGLGTGNPQLRANGLTMGLDGWVYAANGRSDGSVRPVETPRNGAWTRVDLPAQSIRGRDFRFHPDTGAVETLAGRSQFGLGRDDWGNRFLSWNTIPARHEVFPDAFLERNPVTAGHGVLVDILPSGDAGDVHPLAPAPRVFNNESTSHFNALSGLHVFRGTALGEAYRGNVLVGESLRNLVHRRVLAPAGASFLGMRAGPDGREFLASTDPWFHPVGFGTGPDGALYVADFYREFVEHPAWVATDMRARVDWARGRRHGRIWRVRKAGPRPTFDGFRGADPASWVRRLDSRDGWERDTAHRLLLERRDRSVLPPLERVALDGVTPEGRVHALRVAQLLGGVPMPVIVKAAGDPHPRVREHAAVVAGLELAAARAEVMAGRETPRPSPRPLWECLARLARDPDPRVQIAAALAHGAIEDGPRRESSLEALAGSTSDPWVRLAAASSSSLPRREWLPSPPTPRRMPAPPRPAEVAADRQKVLAGYQPALELAGDPRRGAEIVRQSCLACHVLHGHGQRVGPDLASAAGKDPQALLTDILDPSRQVTPDHVAHELVAKDGRAWTGLVASETATRVTLRFPGSPDVSVPVSGIASLRSTGRSLMPDGLEAGLDHADMASLLAFLRKPDPAWLGP